MITQFIGYRKKLWSTQRKLAGDPRDPPTIYRRFPWILKLHPAAVTRVVYSAVDFVHYVTDICKNYLWRLPLRL